MEALRGDADLENLLIDSTAIRAHQHAAGAGKRVSGALSKTLGERPGWPGSSTEQVSGDQAPGRSRGGSGTEVHIAVDALGDPVRLILDSIGPAPLLCRVGSATLPVGDHPPAGREGPWPRRDA